MNQIAFMGVASGIGANYTGCRYAPVRVKKIITTETEVDLDWHAVLHPRPGSSKSAILKELQERIIRQIAPIVVRGSQFIVIDGDHSSAMGIWQGTMQALHPNQRFGLVWIDAHPDLHTFSTSRTGHVHGMPLAALLNQGDAELSAI
ncbi:MAG: arginase family protein, partial [Pseudomonadota bacterium]